VSSSSSSQHHLKLPAPLLFLTLQMVIKEYIFGDECDMIKEDVIIQSCASQADLALMQEDLPPDACASDSGGLHVVVGGSTVDPTPPLTPRAMKSSFQRFANGSINFNLMLPCFMSYELPLESSELGLTDSNFLSSIRGHMNGNDPCGDLGADASIFLREKSKSQDCLTNYDGHGAGICKMGVDMDYSGFEFSGSSFESTAALNGHDFNVEDQDIENHEDDTMCLQFNEKGSSNNFESLNADSDSDEGSTSSPVPATTGLARARHDGEERLTFAAATALSASSQNKIQQRSALNGAFPGIKPLAANRRRVGCSCQRTKCLKLYCECFSAGKTCVPSNGSPNEETCNCRECGNTPLDVGSVQRQAAIVKSLTTKSRTFRPRTQMVHAEGFMENLNPNILRGNTAIATPFSIKKHDLTSPGASISQTSDSLKPSSTNDGGQAEASLSLPPPRCFCKKSRCIKLYCDCFTAGLHCENGRCKCTNCQNLDPNDNRKNSDPAGFSSPKASAAVKNSDSLLAEAAFSTPAAPVKRKPRPPGPTTSKYKRSRRQVCIEMLSQNCPI